MLKAPLVFSPTKQDREEISIAAEIKENSYRVNTTEIPGTAYYKSNIFCLFSKLSNECWFQFDLETR